jgi:hypothetical protein
VPTAKTPRNTCPPEDAGARGDGTVGTDLAAGITGTTLLHSGQANTPDSGSSASKIKWHSGQVRFESIASILDS